MLKFLLSQFIKKTGRNPNNLEMILLRRQASKKAVDERKIISMVDRQPIDANKPIMGGINVPETEADILARLKKGNKDSVDRLKNKKNKDLEDPEKFAAGGVAGLLGERTGYKLGDIVKENIPPEYRLYLKSILPGGEEGKVDESYFTKKFKKELRLQALNKFLKTGKTKGIVEEQDQHRGDPTVNKLLKFPSTYASLGTYTYDIDPKTMDVKITDKYDWNPAYGSKLIGDKRFTGYIGDKKGTDVDLSMFKDFAVDSLRDKNIDKESLLEMTGNFFGGKQSEGKGFDVNIDIPTEETTTATEGSFAGGGRAGLYRGGQAEIEPSLSDIGHGSDALMARNALLTPGSQATTSTGLNYLLGEDNDTTRVPYNEGSKVEGPDPRILELMLNEKMSYEDALKEFENRMKQQPYIDERFNMGPGPILEAAEGGRIGYKDAGPVVLPQPKPKADPMVELQRIYDLYQEVAPGVAQETQKYLQQDFINKLNEANISQEQFMTNRMQNNFANGGRTNFRGGGAYQGGSGAPGSAKSSSKSSTNQGPAGGASSGGNYGGNRNPNQTYGGGNTPPSGPPGGGDPKMTYNAPPVTTGGQSPFSYTTPSFVNKYNNNNIKKSSFLKNFLKHRNASQQMKGMVTGPMIPGTDESQVPNYTHALGGYDFKQNFPNMPESIAKALAYGYQHVTETPRGIMNIDPTSSIFSDTGLIGSVKNSFNKANTEAAKNVEGFTGEGISQSDMDKYNDWQTLNMAQGGPARQNFKMGKRAFLKFLASGAAGIAGLKTGLLGLGKKSAVKSVIAPATQAANEAAVPPYFFKLVNKIKKLGNDVTETGALAERQKVKQYKDFTLTEDTATGRIEVQKVKPFAEGSDNFGNGLTEEVYMGYTPGETIVVKGKPVKKGPEYDEGTAYLRNDGPQTGEVYDEMTGVTDDILEEVGEAIVKKADGGRIGYNLGSKVIGKGIAAVTKKAGEGKFTKNEVLLNMFQNTIKQSKSPDTKKRFINFIEEIKAKPELSKDPNVWNFFTKGLPKNQKLVVYGDDTVDFWTQSEFGPHNIATSAKFQKKHPYLTKDQAVKIQNMEPEDQIFEMKRLEVLRKRTANATGGIAAMLGE